MVAGLLTFMPLRAALHINSPARVAHSSLLCSATSAWLETVYDSLDWEAIIASGASEDADDVDDSVTELTYGESDLDFSASSTPRSALRAAMPTDSAILEAARASSPALRRAPSPSGWAAAASRSSWCPSCTHRRGRRGRRHSRERRPLRGDIYDLDTLSACVGGARVAYCYSSLLESTDGVHVERLSAALAASRLPRPPVVATINRKLCAEDGWREAAAPLRGPTPEESGEGVAYFGGATRRCRSIA